METLPQRLSLVSQTAKILRAEISKNAWGEWLPAERLLCENLQVSRNTLRAALLQLKRAGHIEPRQGTGNRILRARSKGRKERRLVDVSLLAPDPLTHLRPTLTLQIDELRAMLSERGFRLHVFHGRRYFSVNPGPQLRRLVAQNSQSCWVLFLSTAPVQRWFEQNSVPCLVAGSTYRGIKLPYQDLDHRAIGRHAAGTMLGLGHRKIALVIQKSLRAGDIESEEGFIEGVGLSSHPDAEAMICSHDATVTGIANSLQRLMKRASPPTAILVVNAFHYLTVVTRLTQMGWRVPHQVSVISRDDDSFLSFLVPSPARYAANNHAMAKLLLRPILEMLEGEMIPNGEGMTMPEFLRGDSLAPVAKRLPAPA